MLARIEKLQPREKSTTPPLTWHVGFSTNASDKRTLDLLEQAHIEVYYPKIREMRPIPKRRITGKHRASPLAILESVLVPFWPRYFFIRFNLMDGHWHELFEMAHIRGLLCNDQGGKLLPAPIDDSIIAGIKAMEVNGGIPAAVTTQQIKFSIGERVRISGGAFTGHDGTVDRLPDVPIERLDETAKLRLLVSLFGRKSVVELSLSDIKKL